MNALMMQRDRIIKVLERYENANLAAPAARNKIADEILKTFYLRGNDEANKN
tara:strand:- start:265 stop:420 length:156 start_codon:yes stop_codon:yes gene_type:complete